MKLDNNVKTKSAHTGRQAAIICAAVTMFVLCSALVCFADASTGGAHPTASPQAAILEPAPPAQPLDQEAVSALIGELKSGLGTVIEDEDAVVAIGEKWEARDLVGKTRKEVLEILFADVRSVVKDKATQDKVWESWKEQADETEPETPPVKPETRTATPVSMESPAQPVQTGQLTSKCLEGEKTAPDGTCVIDVKFFAQDFITLEAAKNLSAKNGWVMARAEEVQAAWSKKALDVYAFGMLEDGRFAVPVQRDYPNFKTGANIGATGGNQGFLYILASAAARRGVANASPAPEVNVTGTATPITFTKTSGVSVAGNNETKTTPEGWGNSGASSVQIISGDGYVETTVAETNKARMFGLSNGDTNTNYNDIDFAVYLTNTGYLMVYERGANRGTFGRVKTGDVLRVAVQGGVVRYSNTGTVFYTSTIAPSFPLFIDTALRTPGATLQNVVIFSNATVKSDAEKRAEIDRSQPPTATPRATLVPPPATIDDMIDLGEPPLSTFETNQVMTWIAVRVAALRVPFCWRQSYGNTAGEPYTCRPGLERIGLLCYPPCNPGFHHSTANLCTTDCPADFTDIGAFCQKPGPYGRGAGYVIWEEGSCKRDNPQGCEQNGALWYPKCKPGFHAVGCCVCSPDCPADWADTGTGCTKPVYGVGAGEGLAIGVCQPGFEKDPAGALCYPTCKPNFHIVGPVCWQNCPAQQPADCGAGCATKQGECASAVANMVIAPIVAAISLATFGSEGEIAGGVAHGAQIATTTAIEAERVATLAARLKQAYGVIKETVAAVKGNIAELVGGPENLQKIQNMAKAGGKIYTISSKLTKELDLFSKEFADNFDVLTSKEIAAEIDNRFGKDAAYQIKRQWGLSHLTLMLSADGFATSINAIGIVAAADPTGLVGVVAAYMHPICENNTPFPTVHPLYNH